MARLAILIAIVASCGGQTSPAAIATPSLAPTSSALPSPPTSSSTPAATRAFSLGAEPMTRCSNLPRAWCGTLSVPENRAASGSRTIALEVVVVPSFADEPAPDALFVLAGGPGGAATGMASWVPGTFADVLEKRDIVFVDQRGTGGTNRFEIPAAPDVPGASPAEKAKVAAATVAKALAALNADPRQYTTAPAMDDVDDVRAALGYASIDLYGASYGATSAQYYLRQHGDRVRAAVLDGGTLLNVPIFERIAPNSQRALDLVLARCQRDAACSRAYPSVRKEAAAVFARLAKGPISIPATGGTPLVLDAEAWASAIHSALLNASVSAYIPAAVHFLATEDWPSFSALLEGLRRWDTGGGPDLIMSQEIRCSEAWARFDPSRVRRAGAGSYLLGVEEQSAIVQAAICDVVPPGVVPAADAAPVHSDVPVLLVLGDADPQNPPANVADAAVQLPNSRTVAAPGFGHTVGHLGCMPSLIAAFLAAGTADGLDTSCVATMAPPAFVIP